MTSEFWFYREVNAQSDVPCMLCSIPNSAMFDTWC